VKKAASWPLFAAVAGAPLFASTDPAAIAFWCIVLGLSLIMASPRGLDRRHLALIGLSRFVVVAYALVLHEQLASHPWLGLATGLFCPPPRTAISRADYPACTSSAGKAGS
jgi:hypothetical protein